MPSSIPATKIRAMKLVSRDDFAERLRKLIIARGNAIVGPVGLYAERELRKYKGVPNRIFKQCDKKPMRAIGIGPAPVQSTKAYDPSVGSEGIVAQLITEICREFPSKFINHPGPDKIRTKNVRRFIVVTDLIGSGKRAYDYIWAAWRVRSVQSWWSARTAKGMDFEVVGYAATESGRERVKAHRSAPLVNYVTVCPTIVSTFRDTKLKAIRSICRKYAPDLSKNDAMGWGDIGALIAFAHGVPNNAPPILHRSKGKWVALFPKRVTAKVRGHFSDSIDDADALRIRLEAMRQKSLSKSDWLSSVKPSSRALLAVLAALLKAPRVDDAISDRTGLSVMEIEAAIKKGLSLGWIDGRRRLTDSGRAELDNFRKPQHGEKALSKEPESQYYPKSLRVPVGAIS